MKLERAIKILTLHANADPETPLNDLIDAIQLGIEALKRVKCLNRIQFLFNDEALPGETKE